MGDVPNLRQLFFKNLIWPASDHNGLWTDHDEAKEPQADQGEPCNCYIACYSIVQVPDVYFDIASPNFNEIKNDES